MRRSITADAGSLELLLDTICNTFGGVLFISILVVVLLNMTSKQLAVDPPSRNAQAELLEVRELLQDSKKEMSRLTATLAQQERLQEHIFDEPELEGQVDKLEMLRKTCQDRRDQKIALLNDIAESQIEVNVIAQELKNRENAIADAEQKLKALDARLHQEVETRTQTARLPTPRHTRKAEIAFFLRGGRLCSYFKRDGRRSACAKSGRVVGRGRRARQDLRYP